jgi:ethanolamine utilization microcompartment shell protein EutL
VDNGLVYVYRPSSFIGGGVSYDVKVGETPITTLYNGGYFPYFSSPGEIEFWAKTESRSAVTLDVKAGETYFVKGTVGLGILVGRPHLMVMSPETAVAEITDCKLIPVRTSKTE